MQVAMRCPQAAPFQVEDPNFSMLNQVDFQTSGFEGDGTIHETS